MHCSLLIEALAMNSEGFKAQSLQETDACELQHIDAIMCRQKRQASSRHLRRAQGNEDQVTSSF